MSHKDMSVVWRCRSEQSGTCEGEEDLASMLAEGIAKVLLHARLWSAATGKGLQVLSPISSAISLHHLLFLVTMAQV